MVRLRRPGRALAARLGPSSSTAQDAASLRRESAPAAALYLPVGPAAHGVAQATQVQGKELSYNNLNDANAALELVAEFRDGDADGGHRQACQSVRRRDARHACSTRGRRRSPATACRRSAGSSPPTGRSTPRLPRRSPRFSPKSSSRPTPMTDAKAIFARKKNLRLLLTGDAARSGARRDQPRADRRRASGPGPRQRHGHARPAQMRDQAPADRAGGRATACSPGPSPSTSSRTRSFMPRTASPPASAPGR